MKKEQAYKAVTREDLIKDLEQKKEILLKFDLPRARRMANKCYSSKYARQKRREQKVLDQIRSIELQIEDLRKPKKGQASPHVLIATAAGLVAGLEGVSR